MSSLLIYQHFIMFSIALEISLPLSFWNRLCFFKANSLISRIWHLSPNTACSCARSLCKLTRVLTIHMRMHWDPFQVHSQTKHSKMVLPHTVFNTISCFTELPLYFRELPNLRDVMCTELSPFSYISRSWEKLTDCTTLVIGPNLRNGSLTT